MAEIVTINPCGAVAYEEESAERVVYDQGGSVSEIHWDKLKPALEELLRLRDRERLVGFRIRPSGLKCYLETKPQGETPQADL